MDTLPPAAVLQRWKLPSTFHFRIVLQVLVLILLISNSNAVVSHVHLGKEVPQSTAVVNFVLSLVDASNLFANTPGGRGNIKSTYHAIATLAALNAVDVCLIYFLFCELCVDSIFYYFFSLYQLM